MPLHIPFHHSKKEEEPRPSLGSDATYEMTYPRHQGGCFTGISKSAHHAVEVAHHAVEVAVHAVDVAAHSITKHDELQPDFWASECGGCKGQGAISS